MQTMPHCENLLQARSYAAQATCLGCQKSGRMAAYQVAKEGANLGRLFMKCRHCGHFDWLSPAREPDQSLERVQTQARSCPRCNKEQQARRVSKPGPNQGRLFLVCADPACNHFEWASGPLEVQTRPSSKPLPGQEELTEAGLLESMRDNPDDDTPRLIYADWLEENARDPRAELIRLQIQSDQLADEDPRRIQIQERINALLQEHGPAWSGPLATLANRFLFVRGMIDQVEVSGKQFADHAGELLRWAPTANFRIAVNAWGDVKILVACRQLHQLRRLTLVGPRMGKAGASILAESPRIANLKALSLVDQSIGLPGMAALLGSRYLPKLETLAIQNDNFSRGAVPLLASSSVCAHLRRLVLVGDQLGDSDLAALARSSQLSALGDLDLAHNPITSEGAETLARSPLLAQLRRLNLSNTNVGERGIYLIRQSSYCRSDLQLRW